ncbi:acetyltransferase [Magnetospirillum sp. UT-4]|uniref:acetyltransferase n=1 Tax=Magnetospirillum sp. UT-4 TaxID=2681467 RepID=UPI001380D57A|nr:acetyltransferase [Magnetospirillum sp. UT-4]CAA7621679.1 Carbonic anhydrase [Magnetospirillum sp. UT-4]
MRFVPNKPVILVGGGGHARVLLQSLRRLGVPVLGCVVADPGRETGPGVPVLGDDGALGRFSPADVHLIAAFGSLGPGSRRPDVIGQLAGAGWTFASVIDPNAVVADDCDFGDGVQVMAGAVIQPGVIVGAGAIINTRAGIDHDCTIGLYAHVAPGATLSGEVSVGAFAHVGPGAVILEGRRIGTGAMVAAGAVVIDDVPDHARVMGVPARVRP